MEVMIAVISLLSLLLHVAEAGYHLQKDIEDNKRDRK